MTFTQWPRNSFGPQAQVSRTSRRGKPRQPSPRRRVPQLECLEDRLALAVITVTGMADGSLASLAGNGQLDLREAIELATKPGTTIDGVTTSDHVNTLQFDPTLDGKTISVSTASYDDVTGPSAFVINNNNTVVIDGETGLTRGIRIDRTGGTVFRLFSVHANGNLTLQGLTLSDGLAQGFTGGGSGQPGGGSAGLGGAIFNQGSLTLLNSTLTGNTAQGGKGGPFAARDTGGGGAGLGGAGGSSPLLLGPGGAGGAPNGGGGGYFDLLYPSHFSGANALFGGGGGGGAAYGPFVGAGGAGGFGGGGGGGGTGIFVDSDNGFTSFYGGNGGNGGFGGGGGSNGFADYETNPGLGGFGGGNGAFSSGGGGAGMGGAVFNQAGTVVITNSTFTGNTARAGTATDGTSSGQGLGGGLFNHNGTITVTNSTFSGNTAAQGGRGIFTLGDSNTATATITNTIIGQSDTSVSDLVVDKINSGSATVSGGTNLIRTTTVLNSATNNLTGTLTADPLLGPPQNNGGWTPTMALLAGSPAIDQGNSTLIAHVFYDQRGLLRADDGRGLVDIGAYERTALTYVADTVTRLYGAANPAFTGSVSGFALNQSQATATTGTVAFTSPATVSSSVGSYAINGSGLTSLDYDFRQAAGNATALTINAVTAANLQNTLASQSSVTLQVGPTEAATDISAINALTAPSSPVTITLNLTSGSYTDLVASPPANVTLILSGAGGSVTFVGHSPALTVTTGTVIVQQVTFSTPTDSPTILVTGGSLTLRGDTVQESTGGNQPALLITGGTVDLGTAADPGNNTFNVNGPGLLLRDTGPNPVSALGDVFQLNGAQLTDPYRIADLIDDGLDSSGRGLVTFVAQNAFVTMASGDIQRAVNLVPAGYTIDVQAGGRYHEYTVGSKLLTVAFQNGPTLQLVADAAFGPNTTTLRVTGGPQDDTHINIGRGDHGSTVKLHIDYYPDGNFAPTGGIVVHGGGGKKAHIEINPQVTLPALLFADGADAHLQGGGGPTVEVGGGGTDTHLEGGKGRSILIAGTGAAHLKGHSGDDILIGGTTAFDNNEAALLAVLAEWNSGESYLQRIANLQNAPATMNGQTVNPNGSYRAGYYLDAATVHDNGLSDHLEGGGDLDWVFASLGDKIDRSHRGKVLVNIS